MTDDTRRELIADVNNLMKSHAFRRAVDALSAEVTELATPRLAREREAGRREAQQEIRLLIAKWRDSAERWNPGQYDALHDCADELEAALPPAPSEAPKP